MPQNPPIDPDFTAYARHGDEAAFRRLVDTHLELVRATALRSLPSCPHLADDVAQAVFLRLVKRAAALPRDLCLPAWLHRQAVWVARNTVRAETRRLQREKSAHRMNEEPFHDDTSPEPLLPLLDRGLLALRSSDREALVLRYFKNASVDQIAAALGVPAAAAQKRLERATARLRSHLARLMKAPLPQTSLLSSLLTLSQESNAAAPSALVRAISTHALAHQRGKLASFLILMTTTKSALLGAAAGLALALPLIASGLIATPAKARHEPPARQASAASDAPPALGRFSIPTPVAATEPGKLFDQVKLILNEPDTALTRVRLAEFLDQLDAAQLAAIFDAADKDGNDDLLERLSKPLLQRWVALDGKAAMDAILEAKSTEFSNSRLNDTFGHWLDAHYDQALAWMLENQGKAALAKNLDTMVREVSKRYIQRSPEDFIAWARQMHGADIKMFQSAISGAIDGLDNRPTQKIISIQDWNKSRAKVAEAVLNLLKVASAQDDPAFVRDAVDYLLNKHTNSLIAKTPEVIPYLITMPDPTTALWKLLQEDGSTAYRSLSSLLPPDQAQSMITRTVLGSNSLNSLSNLILSDDIAKASSWISGPQRDDMLLHISSLFESDRNKSFIGATSTVNSLKWAALAEDQSRRAEAIDHILQAASQDVLHEIVEDPSSRKRLEGVPPDVRAKLESAIRP